MMAEVNEQKLFALIRTVDRDNFSFLAHKPGYLLCFDNVENRIVEAPGLWKKLIVSSDRYIYYFVKQLDKPLTIKDWNFKWTDGASQIEFDLTASFGIHVLDEMVREN